MNIEDMETDKNNMQEEIANSINGFVEKYHCEVTVHVDMYSAYNNLPIYNVVVRAVY